MEERHCHEWDNRKAYWCQRKATHRVTTLGGGHRRTEVNVTPSFEPLYCLHHAIQRAKQLSALKGYRLGFKEP